MKVSELIAELQKCPQNQQVLIYVKWGDLRPIHDISPEDAEGNVVIGEFVASELFARDFKND